MILADTESAVRKKENRNYLLSRGVEDRLILTEPESVNTLQNMGFSREIIRNTDPEGKAVFATSSYHVFRSGLWAKQAGLPAEGIGSRTKWWFWPNAFVRETAGLLQKRWKQEVLFLAVLVAFFDVLSIVLG
ncbi:MAG: YdcF family protein [Eubacteriales bacterium]